MKFISPKYACAVLILYSLAIAFACSKHPFQLREAAFEIEIGRAHV